MKSSVSVRTYVLFVVGGALGIAVALARLIGSLQYPAGDPRNEPRVQLLISGWVGLFGALFLVAGIVGLIVTMRRGR